MCQVNNPNENQGRFPTIQKRDETWPLVSSIEKLSNARESALAA
jgi:hypothetical protein